jgi:SpoVK/Ycf46/Vps4 family AAA+-type ATPase
VSYNIEEGGLNPDSIGSDNRSEGFSGADLAALVREAGLAVIREWQNELLINKSLAMDKVYIYLYIFLFIFLFIYLFIY